MRIGRNVSTVVNEYDSQQRITDFYMSLETNEAFDDPTTITIRISGSRNFDDDQMAAIAGLKHTLEAKGYKVRFPRVITASVTLNMFEAIGFYVAVRAGEELTNRTIKEILDAGIGAFKRARAKKDEPKRTRKIIIVDEKGNEKIHEVEIEDD
jgi:hypothetical protein